MRQLIDDVAGHQIRWAVQAVIGECRTPHVFEVEEGDAGGAGWALPVGARTAATTTSRMSPDFGNLASSAWRNRCRRGTAPV